MPLITGVQILSDRIAIDSAGRGRKEFLYNSIPAVIVNQGPAAVETWANTWIDDPANNVNRGVENGQVVRYWYAVFHCFSTPIVEGSFTIYVGAEPPPPNWWRNL